jgi:L-threonylcarbamoyladenylate synthase
MEKEEIVERIHLGAIGVIPTDTLYGLVRSALITETVSRIYETKRRNPTKPFIVLIADLENVEQFGVILSEGLEKSLTAYWPGPYSILLPVIDETFEYLHRGTDEIAFRVPDDEPLREFLRETGPLVAPSANIEGDAPARTIEQAQSYFGSDADFYVDGGEKDEAPSTLIRITEDGVETLREGKT